MMIESGTSQCPRLYNVILAGPQHREIRKNSTSNASWRGPNIEKLEPQFQQAMQVGDNEINFIKISFLSHPMHESNYVFLF